MNKGKQIKIGKVPFEKIVEGFFKVNPPRKKLWKKHKKKEELKTNKEGSII